MPSNQTCPQCHEPLPANAASWLCPRCLLGDAVAKARAEAPPPEPVSIAEQPGERLGRYKLLQKLGEGGMGTVWMAEQMEPVRRRVALKILKAGMDTREVILRFEAERQALALMDHSNIARVFDAGAMATGRPYFVMELVPGIRLTDYCDQNRLSVHERLDLFMKVCHAVQHAHQKGIIHRDLKPSNILVTLHDGVPVPKVIDFGIAKATAQPLTERTLFTQLGAMLGTPAYMSPEQTELSGLDIDTRSDIYSLGVLLYQLLTGRPPFEPKELMAGGLEQMCRIIRENEPPRPSTRLTTLGREDLATLAKRHGTEVPRVVSLVRGDLDWIVMKCLEKDRRRRYDTANGLAADILRHLANEPVVARPPSATYRLQKLVRRHRVACAAGAAVALALIAGAGLAAWQAVRATQAEKKQRELRRNAETAQMAEAAQRRQVQAELERNKEFGRIFQAFLSGVRPETARGRDTIVLREMLDRASTALWQQFSNQGNARLEIARSMAQTYEKIREFKRAEDLYRQALRESERVFSRTNYFTAWLMNDIAIEILSQGVVDRQLDPARLDEAEALVREGLAHSRRYFGTNHADQALFLDTLGDVFTNRGDLTNAAATYREGMEVLRDKSKKQAQHALFQLNLASILAKLGQHDEAYRMAEQCIGKVDSLGEERAFMPHGIMGSIAMQQRYYARAERCYAEWLAAHRRLHGNASYRLIPVLRELGSAAYYATNLVGAEDAFREMLTLSRQRIGATSSDARFSMGSLARALAARRSAAEGLTLVRDKAALDRQRHATNAARLGRELADAAGLLAAFGEFADAETTAREAVRLLGARRSAAGDDLLRARAALGWALTEQAWAGTNSAERTRQGVQELRVALADAPPDTTNEVWRVAELRSQLGFALAALARADADLRSDERQARLAEAEVLLLQGQKEIAQSREVDFPHRRTALHRLARFYAAWNESAPQAGHAARAADWAEKLAAFDAVLTRP